MTRLSRLLFLVVAIGACMSITGCWSATEVQEASYVKAIGIDYKDKQFILYVQLLDFSNIAKSEAGGKANEQAIVWVGKGKGETLVSAINDLYKTAQYRISWGHVSAIVLSEAAVYAHGAKIADMINRYPEIRYNAWVYGTRSPMEKVLATTPFFKLSPLASIIHDPRSNYKQSSLYPPVLFFKYIAKSNEPSTTSYLPSLGINSVQWSESETKMPMLMINGAFFEYGEQAKGFIPRAKLAGYHWLVPHMNASPLVVKKDGRIYAELRLRSLGTKIIPVINGQEVFFHIKAKYKAEMFEYLIDSSYKETTQIAEELIKEEIMATYKEGLKIGVDLYELGHVLRLKQPALWKKLSNNGKQLVINSQSIKSIDIKVNIPYNGKYKRQTK